MFFRKCVYTQSVKSEVSCAFNHWAQVTRQVRANWSSVLLSVRSVHVHYTIHLDGLKKKEKTHNMLLNTTILFVVSLFKNQTPTFYLAQSNISRTCCVKWINPAWHQTHPFCGNLNFSALMRESSTNIPTDRIRILLVTAESRLKETIWFLYPNNTVIEREGICRNDAAEARGRPRAADWLAERIRWD